MPFDPAWMKELFPMKMPVCEIPDVYVFAKKTRSPNAGLVTSVEAWYMPALLVRPKLSPAFE